jgi:hypothetical protein
MCTLLVGVFLVGCGGSSSSSSKADYKKKVLALTNTFRSQFTASQTKIQTTSDPNGKADAVDEVKTEYSNLANDLDKLKAPGGAQPAQDASVSALRKGVDDLGRLSDAARARDQAKARQVAAALTRDGADVTSKLQELGTKVGG